MEALEAETCTQRLQHHHPKTRPRHPEVLVVMALVMPRGQQVVRLSFLVALGAPSPVLPQPVALLCSLAILVNLSLFFFNLLPIPPLDGSKVLAGLLPRSLAAILAKLEPFGFILLLILFYTGTLQKIIMPIIALAQGLITG